ncbi:MAG: adenosylcobinamide-GDP ribazoletransferase [Moraxella sp.]
MTLAYLRYIFCQKINGITGDTVGASVEIIEITILLAYLA